MSSVVEQVREESILSVNQWALSVVVNGSLI